jgi:hypothetical protein
MARRFPTLDLSRLRFFLDLLRRSVRGCRFIWTALWRFLWKSFTTYPPRLQHSLASVPSSLQWNNTGRDSHRQSDADANVCLTCDELIDPIEGVSAQGTEVVTGAALPISEGFRAHSADLTQRINPQILSTASTQIDGLALASPSVEPSSVPDPLSHRSSGNDGDSGDEEINISVLSPSCSPGAPASSDTSNDISLHVLPGDAWSRNGSSHSIVGSTVPSNPLHHTQFVESSASSSWEISPYIWPMMPAQVPRYENNRIV